MTEEQLEAAVEMHASMEDTKKKIKYVKHLINDREKSGVVRNKIEIHTKNGVVTIDVNRQNLIQLLHEEVRIHRGTLERLREELHRM